MFQDPNRVPAAPIIEALKKYLAQQEDLSDVANDDRGTTPTVMFALRCDIKADTLDHMLKGHAQTIDFDIADRIITKMNAVDLWWGPLNDVYEGAILIDGYKGKTPKPQRASGAVVCAADNCANEFVRAKKGGGHTKVYCSHKCKQRMTYRKHKGLQGRYGNIDKCPHGHEWTPENTRVDLRTNKKYCKRCQADYQKKRRAKETPEERQQRIDYLRSYTPRKRERIAA